MHVIRRNPVLDTRVPAATERLVEPLNLAPGPLVTTRLPFVHGLLN